MPEANFTSVSAGRNFTLILNEAIRDPRISWRAKGILAGCLSHAENFVFSREWIISHGTEGRDAIKAALRELREFGYLQNIKTRNADGRITGEIYKFTDQAVLQKPTEQAPPEPQDNRRTDFQAAGEPADGKPADGFSVRQRKPIEEKQIQEPPYIPPPPARTGRSRSVRPLFLPEWLEPHRAALEQWQANRKKAHPRVDPGLTKSTVNGLMYARDAGVLAEYCEYASEKNWQSLGFVGSKELIDKIARESGKKSSVSKTTNKVNYTLS